MTARKGNMGKCHPEKTNVDGVEADILLNVMKYIVYITFSFKTIHVKLIFEFAFRTPLIQTLIRRQSESRVKRTRINSAQSILFEISPVVK